LVAVYPVTFLRNIISTVFTYLISLLDRTVRWFETLPHATWNGIFLPAPEMVLIYAMILSGILLFVYCKPKALLRLLFFICLFQASMLWRDLDRYNRRILAVYASSRSTVIGLYHGDKGLILLDSNSFNSRETKMGIVSSHLTGMGITEFAYEQLPVMSGSGPDLKAVSRFGINCCQFGDKRICIIDRELPPMTTSCRRIQADLVILRNDKTIEMKDVLCLIDAPLVVVDASVPVWIASRWKKEFPDKVFVVAVQGAYVKKWK
jgi:hypothetical protein